MDWVNLAVAALIGLVVGIGGNGRGHASGPRPVRWSQDVFLLGIIGGAAGLLIESNAEFTAGILLAGGRLGGRGVLMAAAAVPSRSRRPKPRRSRCWHLEPWPVPGRPSSRSGRCRDRSGLAGEDRAPSADWPHRRCRAARRLSIRRSCPCHPADTPHGPLRPAGRRRASQAVARGADHVGAQLHRYVARHLVGTVTVMP